MLSQSIIISCHSCEILSYIPHYSWTSSYIIHATKSCEILSFIHINNQIREESKQQNIFMHLICLAWATKASRLS